MRGVILGLRWLVQERGSRCLFWGLYVVVSKTIDMYFCLVLMFILKCTDSCFCLSLVLYILLLNSTDFCSPYIQYNIHSFIK